MAVGDSPMTNELYTSFSGLSNEDDVDDVGSGSLLLLREINDR